MRVSWGINIYNLLRILLLTRCYRFPRCEYYLWLDSKYNVRRCDVLVQNKTIHSLNLFRTWSNISLKMATWAIGKTFHVIRGRMVALSFLSFQSGLTSLCFVDDLCQILGMFSLNSIGCVTKVRSCWHSGGKYNRQMYVKPTCSNLHTERFEVIF